MCIKPVLGERQNESLFLEKSQMISLLLCDTLDNVLFLAWGLLDFATAEGTIPSDMHTGNPTRTSAHTCALALHSLAPSRALFTVLK